MKAYFLGNTGKGKTASVVFIALLYNLLNPNCDIFSNCVLKLKNFHYSEFMFLPMERIRLGKCLLIFDDYKALSKLNNYSSILAIFSRKVYVDCLFTIQYPIHLTKEIRDLCHCRIEPNLIGQKFIDGSYAKDTLLRLNFMPVDYTDETIYFSLDIKNIFKIIDGIYDSNQLPEFLNEYTAIKEIAKVSESFKDVYQNVQLYTKAIRTGKRMRKEVCKIMNIECLY